MGGKALSVPSIRLNRGDYLEYEKMVIEMFVKHDIKVHTIKQIEEKESFGDLDVVIDIESRRELVEQIIMSVSTELVKNTDVWSFGIDGFQIDVVFSNCPDYTATWMAYSDAANICGRVFHKLGLKHGHLELYLPLREDTKVIGNVSLSHNIDDAHTLIGLDPAKWHDGFKNTTEIYEWVATSPFYNPDIFLLDNRNAKARYRDAKRPTYTGMLEWIEKQPKKDRYQFSEDKSVYLPMIFEKFPHAEEKYNALIELANFNKSVREAWQTKLPATFIMVDTGFGGHELGEFIRDVKLFIGTDNILHGSPDAIMSLYKEFKETHYAT